MITLKRLILYLFPIYLIFVEYAIRFSLGEGREGVSPFTLAGSTNSVVVAGLSLIAPTLIPKSVSLQPAGQQVLAASGVVALRVGDARLIVAAVAALLTLPIAWGWALYMLRNGLKTFDLAVWRLQLPGPFLVALAIYVVGIIFNEAKEYV